MGKIDEMILKLKQHHLDNLRKDLKKLKEGKVIHPNLKGPVLLDIKKRNKK